MYLYLPLLTSAYLCLPLLTSTYLYLPLLTSTYLYLLGSRLSQLLSFPLDGAAERSPQSQSCLDALLQVLRTGEQAGLEAGLDELHRAASRKAEES